MLSLCDRRPQVDLPTLAAAMVPPPRFDDVSFATYLPDPGRPSQAVALRRAAAFAESVSATPSTRRSVLRRRARVEVGRPGLYLDGGFGVGKTHLLASLFHAAAPSGRCVFGTFVELTNLVGSLGFARTVAELSDARLLCIDEFELDDPGDTVLISSLLRRLVEAGVRIAATSNTLPDRLGEGRFAADDFLREIQGLAAHFDVVRIDGDDYRHRGLPAAPPPADELDLARIGARPRVAVDAFPALLAHLSKVHPSRYGALVDGVDAVCWRGVRQVPDQAAALRLVVLADRLYDRDVAVVADGLPLDAIFSADMLAGGYRAKYRRAVSRLVALAHEGVALQREAAATPS